MSAVLPPLSAEQANSNMAYGDYLWVDFDPNTLSNSTTNPRYFSLFQQPLAPTITSVTSDSCDSLSPLQLANCHAMAVLTVTGTNLAVAARNTLSVSSDAVWLGNNILLASNYSFELVSNDSLVFELAYFDAANSVQLQPNTVYDVSVIGWYGRYSNEFRLSLTYEGADGTSSLPSGGLSSGAVAGIVVSAVLVALLLSAVAVWLVQRQLLCKSASGETQWAEQGGVQSSSSGEWRHVEMQ